MHSIGAPSLGSPTFPLEGDQHIDRLEAEINALWRIWAEQQLIAEMRALVKEPRAQGKRSAPKAKRHADKAPDRLRS